MIENGDFFEEGDVLELALSNGAKIRGIVNIKGKTYCKLLFCSATGKVTVGIIGKEVRIFYNEKIIYNGMEVKNVKKIPNEITFNDEQYHVLKELAVNVNDENWFNEIIERQQTEVG